MSSLIYPKGVGYMNPAQKALTIALLACIAGNAYVYTATFEWVWLAYALRFILGAYAVALGVLFFVSFFPVTDDLWESTYFQFMRGCWGYRWGGANMFLEPRQISVCRAAFLSAWTLMLFLLTSGAFLLIWLFTIVLLFGGLDSVLILYPLADTDPPGLLFLFSVTQTFLLLITAFGWKKIFNDGVGQIDTHLSHHMMGVGVVTCCLVPLGIVVGVFYIFGAVKVGITSGVVILGLALIAGIIALVIKICTTIRETVPVLLMKSGIKGWKDRFCPLIIGQIKNPKK